jgi:hypothetical protein
MEEIGIGEEAKPPSPLQGENDLRDLLIFYKNIVPYEDKHIKGNREVKFFFYGLEKFRRGDFSNIKIIDYPFLKIEKVKKYSLGILKFFSSRESGEFFCNLVMVERENDIT